MAEEKVKQFWAGETSRQIQKRIVVEGDLVLKTPANFGGESGDDLVDMPLLVDAYDEATPLLLGSTLAGALRSYLRAREKGYRAAQPKTASEKKKSRSSLTGRLFGAFKGDDGGMQSALIVEDAFGHNFCADFRDGVKIDSSKRTAKGGALFDMQVWLPGTTFPIRLELLITESRQKNGEAVGEREEKLKQALLIALSGLSDGGITLGARKRRGFGRIGTASWRAKSFDMLNPQELCDWLANGHKSLAEQGVAATENLNDQEVFDGIDAVLDQRSIFSLQAIFDLDSSMLIRSTGTPGVTPDMVHLGYSAQEPLLPGTSVAGVLRARAQRILNLLLGDEKSAGEWLDDIFGSDLHQKGSYVEKEGAKASRLVVEERLIEKKAEKFTDLIQNRVAIDRFTGGAKDAALFDEKPLWRQTGTVARIHMHLQDPKPAEMGLLLLLLKDLWTADLPIGGESSVGRGRLRGREATMRLKKADSPPQEWHIEEAGGELVIDDETRSHLESFVKDLTKAGRR